MKKILCSTMLSLILFAPVASFGGSGHGKIANIGVFSESWSAFPGAGYVMIGFDGLALDGVCQSLYLGPEAKNAISVALSAQAQGVTVGVIYDENTVAAWSGGPGGVPATCLLMAITIE